MISTRYTLLAATVLAVVLVLVAPLAAQDLERLRDDFLAQASSLEADIESYFDARERENEALAELARLGHRLDDTLGDPQGSVADLVKLETQVAVARERAFGLSETSAKQRQDMYEEMRQLAVTARQLERLGIGPAGAGVAGSWHLEATFYDIHGIFDLRQDGSLVIGSYRLSNGAAGSVKGTFAGSRLEIELVDSERGAVGKMDGELDRESGEISGTWQALELGGGRPTAADWTARRLTLEEG